MIKVSALITIATLALIESVKGTISFGNCEKPEMEANFDFNRYLGTWHEYCRDKNIIFLYGECNQGKFSMKSNGLIEAQYSL